MAMPTSSAAGTVLAERETGLTARPMVQDPYIRHQFGFSLGGPIRKDKTFFFFNDEMDRFITTLTGTAVVPTAAFKTGAFNFTYVDPNTLGLTTVPVDLSPS